MTATTSALETFAAETPTLCLPYEEVEDLCFAMTSGTALLAGGRLDQSHPDYVAAADAIHAHVARVAREAMSFLNEDVDQSWLFFASRAAEKFLDGNIVGAFDFVKRFDLYWTGATLREIIHG